MTRRSTRATILFGVLLAVGIAGVLAVAFPLWQPLFVAFVIAAALRPVHDWATLRLGGRRTLASALLVVALALLVLLPLAGVVVFAANEATDGAKWLRDTLHAGGPEALIGRLPGSVRGYVQRGIDALPSSSEEVAELARERGGSAAAVVGGALSAVGGVLAQTVLMLLAVHFLFVDGQRLTAWLARESPAEDKVLRLAHGLGRASRSIVSSLFATALIQAATATLGYFIGRVSHPIFFGLLTFVAAFIPSVGTTIVALPLAGLMLALGHPWAALFLAAWALIVVGLIDNVVKPWLMKDGMELHGAVVFFALLGGIAAFGAVGLFVGPLAMAFFVAVVELGKAEPPGLVVPGAPEES